MTSTLLRLSVVALSLAATLPVHPASANLQRAQCDTSMVRDPQDSEVAIDIADVSYAIKGKGKNRLLVTCVRAHDDWLDAQLVGGGIILRIDEAGKPECIPGRCTGSWTVGINFRSDPPRLHAWMWELDDSEDSAYRALPAWRLDDNTVAFGIKRRWFHAKTYAYWYDGLTAYSTGFTYCALALSQERCRDDVPLSFGVPLE